MTCTKVQGPVESGQVEAGRGATVSGSCWLALVIAAIVAMGMSGEALGQSPSSCEGICGEWAGTCGCVNDCEGNNQCCDDYCDSCEDLGCGACCVAGTCYERLQYQCVAMGGTFQGWGSACTPDTCEAPPPPATCEDNCGGYDPSAPCQCDAGCCSFQDCCDDKCEHCGDGVGNCDNDGQCVASSACGDPDAGDCCVGQSGSPYCDDEDCCALICAADPFCCNVNWDGVCASLANDLCAVCAAPPPPPPDPTLAVRPNPSVCYQVGDTATVVVEMRDMVDVVVGGQYFLAYDASVLEFVSASPGLPPSPFTLEIYEFHVPGFLIYATGVDVDGGGPGGTDGDAVMAILTFTTLADDVCLAGGLVAIAPGTKLSDEFGMEVLGVVWEDLSEVTIDSTAPVLNVPADVVIECDVAGDRYAGTGAPGDCAGNCGGFDPNASCQCDNACESFGDCCAGVCLDCPGLNHCSGMASATDNCDPDPVVTYTDTVVPGTCPQEFTVQRAWVATDCSGNESVVVQTISIVDTTPPVVDGGSVPSDMVVFSDAGAPGGCGAAVSWTPPTATDNCSAPGDVTVTSSHQPGDFFAVGPHTVTYWFTDECGNESSASFNIEVLGVSRFLVNVDALGLEPDINNPGTVPVDRCIEFVFSGDDSDTISAVLTFLGGSASAELEVLCGSYDCVSARDPLHTLNRDQTASISGTDYAADFTGADFGLVGGDLNDDNTVDILDFGVFVWQFGANYGGGDTICSTAYPHADISGDGLVGSADFGFIQINFLEVGDGGCPEGLMPGGDVLVRSASRPLRRISVSELRRRGLGHLAIADLNQDGWVDETDIVLWLSGKRP